jgi:tRNA (adenine57-N1/adenine58-N1)-methyltransferase
MFECLIRPHEVSTQPKPLSISKIIRRLQDADVKREERRQRQITNAILRNSAKRKREDETGGVDQDPRTVKEGSPEASETGPKRLKIDQATSIQETEMPGSTVQSLASAITPDQASSESPQTQIVSRVIPEVRGHTSYLTFAIKLPLRISI